MFYGYEKTFQSLGKLGQDIIKTTNRIKVKQNILRLVVRKSPTGESTHYFFRYVKVEVSC